MKKILVLANSFGEDCTAYMEKMSSELYVRNLYVPACSLEQHSEFIERREDAYQYQKDAVMIGDRLVSANDAFAYEQWDYIVLQQVSFLAGKYDSYYPYLTEIIEYIKKVCPQVSLVLNETWSYEKGSTHEKFYLYGNDPLQMIGQIRQACERVAKENGMPLIRTGEFIQRLRQCKAFQDGSLCRDTYHLSTEYGRYAASAFFVRFFGADVLPDFMPDNAQADKIRIIQENLIEFERYE